MILPGSSQSHGCQQLLAHQAINKAAQIIQLKAKTRIELFERIDLNCSSIYIPRIPMHTILRLIIYNNDNYLLKLKVNKS